MLGAKNASITSVWFMPEGDIETAKKTYDISYVASSYDELYEALVDGASKDSFFLHQK